MITLLTYSLLGAKPFDIASNYIPVGINAGAGNDGGVIGAELSFVHLGNHLVYGLFFDALRNKEGYRGFAGPEIFFPLKSGTFIGLEAGAATYFRTSEYGFMTGLFFFMKNPIIPYIRYFHIAGKNTAEAGVLIKIPLPIEN
ncbi:MAG: hypothetical protein KAZ87_06500 [Spirochaetes bacterium]|nr:hypothetical protein [Spirochaetota bacterium]